jgi:hypothetical protein
MSSELKRVCAGFKKKLILLFCLAVGDLDIKRGDCDSINQFYP